MIRIADALYKNGIKLKQKNIAGMFQISSYPGMFSYKLIIGDEIEINGIAVEHNMAFQSLIENIYKLREKDSESVETIDTKVDTTLPDSNITNEISKLKNAMEKIANKIQTNKIDLKQKLQIAKALFYNGNKVENNIPLIFDKITDGFFKVTLDIDKSHYFSGSAGTEDYAVNSLIKAIQDNRIYKNYN